MVTLTTFLSHVSYSSDTELSSVPWGHSTLLILNFIWTLLLPQDILHIFNPQLLKSAEKLLPPEDVPDTLYSTEYFPKVLPPRFFRYYSQEAPNITEYCIYNHF